ncbi:hypothetical protein M2408_002605 [Sphingobacterium sp. BIGb0165]|nr:hypothetical protein [Sphingobacterium sp. BIGb0165]
MIRVLLIFCALVVVSCYFFSFGFTFLPPSVNTKIILAGVGCLLLFGQMVLTQRIEISKQLFTASVLAIVFSLVCFIATDVNRTDDFAYATYFMSFAIWLLAAYTVAFVIYKIHGFIDFHLLTFYLAAACLLQCVLAFWIDSSPAVQSLVDRYIEQGQSFAQEVDRLYGIGASLDNAGVRFSIVLIMLSTLFTRDLFEKRHIPLIVILVTTFFAIFVLGNVISRTTSIGGALGFAYILLSTGLFSRIIRIEFVRFFSVVLILLFLATLMAIYFYESNAIFKGYMQFAFEGFFNFYKTGEWRTDSTDKLAMNMWVWPTDTKTWLIGTGLFDGWIFNTDIGYCRFVLYCGILGFSVFVLFFVFNAIAFMKKYSKHKLLFLMLLAFSFAIWFKVSTDIFLIYALFYCVEGLQGALFTTKFHTENENRLFYLGNV